MRIETRGLGAQLGGATVLEDVRLDLRPGEMVGLIGPNGAGKSTLLRVVAGLVAPSAGSLRYDGKTLNEIGRAGLARRLSFLPQDGEAHWPLRVDHVVALGRLPHRRPFAGMSAHDHEAVERALVAAEVAHLRRRTVGTLSGGERMRALIARALAVEAETLLADEPVSALDPLHQLRIMRLLTSTARDGACVVAVLHDLTLAARFCDRLVLLSAGRMLLDGPPSKLSDGLIEEAYGVAALRGEHCGQPFVLPWSPLSG